ncbi:MAG: hypothetical protein WCT22_00045 [Patescibacteria group bacterium]
MKRRINRALGLVAVVLLTACSFLQPVSVESKAPQIGEAKNIVIMTGYELNDPRTDLIPCQIGGPVLVKERTFWIEPDNEYLVIEPMGTSKTTCKGKRILVREEPFRSAIEAQATRTSIEGTQSAVAEDAFIDLETGTPTPLGQKK